ncbi:MAG: glycosyltransferase family 2 protein [Bacteroidales bacterium]|nr:glycosyltransferase family 2 protein [Porphyromonas sp.]MDD6935057.1 glycosyltransferase family 2 protein [Bacteroidales bacterium]MDY3102380.1 glycosyltransferase family 2 protein [Porphyromonas sp.]
MNSTPLLTVGILNWNGAALLRQFLPSVLRYTPHEKARIVVIDNGSSDDSLEVMRQEFPNVEVLSLDQNHGFAGGYNLAIKQCNTPYYCLLNSDIEVTEGWIDAPLALLEAHHELGAVQPKIRSYHRRSAFEYAGAAGGFIDYLGYPFCRGRLFDFTEEDHGQYDTEIPIFWASGAALFVRREAYLSVGGLDEMFFAHMEEIDLCWRLYNKGYKLVYTPHSLVYHVGGASLSSSNAKKVYLNFRNNLLMLYKNLPPKEGERLIQKRMLLDGLSAIMYLVKGKIKFAKAIYQAHQDFKRMRIYYPPLASQPSEIPSQLIYRRSIVWHYFVLRKKRFSDLNT